MSLKCAARRPGEQHISDWFGPGYIGDPVWAVSRARSLSGGSWLVERTAVACMEQQLAKLRVAALAGLGVAPPDHRLCFQDAPVYPRQVASTVAMPAFSEVAREWVQNSPKRSSACVACTCARRPRRRATSARAALVWPLRCPHAHAS